jgi:hypothetical protein
MSWHLYLLPLVGTYGSYTDPPRPKYVEALHVNYGLVTYGEERIVICGADVTDPQDASIVANADVFRFPDNLDTALTGGTLNQLQNALEADNVPASNWLSIPNTYRTILRTVYGFFSFMDRFAYLHGQRAPIIGTTGVTLNTRFQDLAPAIQADLIKTSDSFGFNTGGLDPASTIRQMLKFMADQFSQTGFNAGQIQV